MNRRVASLVARLTLLTLVFSMLPGWSPIAQAKPMPILRSLPEEALEARGVNPEQHLPSVELTSQRTPNSRTLRNADGSLTTEVFAKPIHSRDGSNSLQVIQKGLFVDPSTSAFHNSNRRYQVQFQASSGNALFNLNFKNRSLSMELDGALRKKAALNGKKVVYPGVMPGVDLHYTVESESVKEEIIIQSRSAVVPEMAFTFSLMLKGATVKQDVTGGLKFEDEQTGEVLWTIPPMFMRDRIGQLSGDVSLQVRQTGNRIRLTVQPDVAWLMEPERVYPVVIDPTIYLQPDFAGGLDTTIANGDGQQNLNLGFDSVLSVGSQYSSLLKFDLSSIPRASSIQSATLELTSLSSPAAVNTTGVPAPKSAPALGVSAFTSSLRAGTYTVRYSYLTPQGETDLSPAGTITISNYQGISVNSGGFPAGVTGMNVYMGAVGSERLALTTDTPEVSISASPAPNAAYPPAIPRQPAALTVTTSSGSLAAGTYSVMYTYVTDKGESQTSPPAVITVPSSKGINVNVGAIPPGVTGVKVYVGLPDAERYRATTTTPEVVVTALPSSSAARPPDFSAVHVADPTVKPTLLAATAPAGKPGFSTGTYHVRYAYLNSLGETLPSPSATIGVVDGQAIQVNPGKFPTGVAAAHVYVGYSADMTFKVGSIPRAASNTAFTFDTPPALMAAPAPAQAAAVLPNPSALPTLSRVAGTSPFLAGTYRLAYSFYSPNGETAASPIQSITLVAGDVLTVTAGQQLPPGATGMHVYLGGAEGSLYRVATLPAVPADGTPPSVRIDVPSGYFNVVPPTSSSYGSAGTPSLRAVDLNTPTRLKAGTYYVSYSWIYLDGESYDGTRTSITIKDGQAIEVTGATPPANSQGMRVYMGRTSSNRYLVATSMGNRTIVTGDMAAPLAPAVNSTSLTAPGVSTVNLSALPAGTYYVAHTWTTEASESAPSPVATVAVRSGEAITVTLPPLPSGALGANLYLGTAANYLRLVTGTTETSSTIGSLPAGQAAILFQEGRGVNPPSKPVAAPVLKGTTLSSIAAGTYSVRYTYTSAFTELPASPAASVSISTGQAISVVLPPLPAGMSGANLYVGSSGQERLAASGVVPDGPVTLTSLNPSGRLVPTAGAYPLTAPTVTSSSGGTLTGDVYFSYSFLGEVESPRSPETWRTFTSPNGTAVLTTGRVPEGASRIRVYAGAAPGEGRLVHEGPVTAGQTAVVTVNRRVPTGIAVHAVTTPWAELDATWIRASANTPWLSRGGDYERHGAVAPVGGGAQVEADLTQLVRQWAEGKLPNNGVLLKGVGATTDFASSDHADEALRPLLRVTYRTLPGGPVVTLTSPASGASLAGDVTLTASVRSPDPNTAISRVDFYVNGARVGSATSAPYSVVWSTASLPAGNYTITARAYDQWGQEGRSDWTTVINDTFEDAQQIDPFASTLAPDLALGLVTLPVTRTAISTRGATASSEKTAESYPLTNMLDGKNDTFWRSPGQPTASASESVRLDLPSAQSSVYLTVRPRNAKDGLAVKVQGVSSAGDVVGESYLTLLDADTKNVSLSTSKSFTAIRLVFTNLKRELASGLYHAEVAEVTGATLKPASTTAYSATYEATNASDGILSTRWVSAGVSSPTGQEYLELDLAKAANAVYIKPRTPGVTATVARYAGTYAGWEPVLHIASLNEGVYTLPPGVTLNRFRIYFTNLAGMSGPGAPNLFFAGIDEVIPYDLTLGGTNGSLESRLMTLPQRADRFLLEVDDSQPPGSSIAYSLYDGDQWRAVTPGLPIVLSNAVSAVKLRAEFQSGSTAVPSLGGWQLRAYRAHEVMLQVGADVTPPTAELVRPSASWLSGTATLKVAAWDDVGVTRVELYDGANPVPIATSTTWPFDLVLDTTKLQAGSHRFWVKAYDAAGNVSASMPPTTTYQAFNHSLNSFGAIDLDMSATPVLYGGRLQNSTSVMSDTISGTGTISRSFTGGPGLIEAWAPNISDATGCVAGYVQIKRSTTVVAENKVARGECRDLHVTYSNEGYPSTTFTVVFQQDTTGGNYTGSFTYHNALAASTPYDVDRVVSKPTVTPGDLVGVTLKPNATVTAGTSIRYYASANDGLTWQEVLPNQYAAFNHNGNRLRLRADLHSGRTSGTYNNLTPYLSGWSADVTQFLAGDSVIVSQLAPPAQLSATQTGSQVALQWAPSPDGPVTYNVYRAEEPHPTGSAHLVASGLTSTSITDGSNLLRNSSFESGSSSSFANWTVIPKYRTECDEIDCWDVRVHYSSANNQHTVAGRQSLYVSYSSSGTYGAYQDVTISAPAGTTFSLSARLRGQNVIETSAQALVLRLTYTDNTTATATVGGNGGTFDWVTRKVQITATKSVKQVRATVQLYGRGAMWFDTVQLDTAGADTWVAGDIDPNKVYYYRVTAVDATDRESAPSNEASTGAAIVLSDGLGLKSFWPYSGVQMAGGEGYVNLHSGNLVYTATDLVQPSRLLALTFRRTYNAQAAQTSTPVGLGWDHNYNWRLSPGTGGAMVLKEGDGSTFRFMPKAGGGFDTPPGSRMNLVKGADGTYTVARYDNNLLYRFATDGRLVQIAEPNGNAISLSYDASGRLRSASDATGQTMEFRYNTAGQLVQVVHPGDTSDLRRFTEYEYDSLGRLIVSRDLEGNSVHYGYDMANRLFQVTNANRHTTEIVYTGGGSVQAVTYADGARQSFTYGALGSNAGWTKSTVADGLNFVTTYELDQNGLLKRQTFPYGTATPTGTSLATVTFEHDDAWNITSYTDPRNNAYRIAYDGYRNVTSVTDPAGSVTRSQWTVKAYPGVSGQWINTLASMTDALGNTTLFTTDTRGNVVRVEDALRQVTEMTYDTFGQRLSIRDGNGHSTQYAYNAKGWLVRQTNHIGAATVYTYDAGGNPTTITDPVGNHTHYAYDRLGRQQSVTFADGAKLHVLYDGAGNLIQQTDPVGALTRYEYDVRGRVVTTTQWPNAGNSTAKSVTNYEYDLRGLPTAVVDPRGNRSLLVYDGAGRLLTATDPLAQKTTWVYDAAGNPTKVTDGLGRSVTLEYDNLNRRTKTIVPVDTSSSNNMTQTVTYDALGRMTSMKDALGNTSQYYYDAVGRLVMVVDPMGFATNYAYDQVGQRIAVTDAQRRTTQYVYDAAHRLVQERRPDGVILYNTYDLANRLLTATNGRGQTTGYRYDQRNNLVEVNYPSGKSVRLEYDAVGRQTSMSDWVGITRYRYNQMGWLEQVEDPFGTSLEYSYDLAGNRTDMRLRYFGNAYLWTYAYDAVNRLTSLQSPGVAKANTFTYNAANLLTKATYANNATVSYTYDYARQLKSISSSGTTGGTDPYGNALPGVSTMSYTYDKAGRRTYYGGNGNQYYQYDAGSRLTASGPSSSATEREYYYDLVGNRHTLVTNSGDPKGVFTYVYDQANRLIEEFGPIATKQGGGRYHQSYTYDADGNQTRAEKDGKEVTLYFYDEASRLQQVTNPLGQLTRYTYFGDGRRAAIEDPAETTRFIYDGNEVLAEVDATGAIQMLYTRMPSGQLLSQWRKGETYWYHLDGLGSTVALTDESGRVRNRYNYDDFGRRTAGTAEEIFNRYTYTGQAWDATAGLYHYKARYYNPDIGRFITQDTWKGSPWQPWTQHLYAYVGNNPVNYVDPTGHRAQQITVDGKNKTVTISWDVEFYGDGASTATVDTIVDGIKSHWSGTYDGFEVSVVVNSVIRSGSKQACSECDQVLVHGADVRGRSFVNSVWFDSFRATERHYGELFLTNSRGGSEDIGWVAAHEFGHFLGLSDRYTDKNGANKGWEGNMMAEHGGRADMRNIREIVHRNYEVGRAFPTPWSKVKVTVSGYAEVQKWLGVGLYPRLP